MSLACILSCGLKYACIFNWYITFPVLQSLPSASVTGELVQIRWAGFAWLCEYQAKRNSKCSKSVASIKLPATPAVVVAFGFIIPVKIALHIQPNFPYSMLGEVLQMRLQKRLWLSLVPKSKLYVCVIGGQVQILWADLAGFKRQMQVKSSCP